MNGVRDRVVVAVAPGTSTDAVGTAFELAAERGISVLAVRAWHDPDVPLGGWLRPHGTAQWDALHQKAREELDRAVEHAKAAHPAVEVEMVVVDDDPVPFLAALSAGPSCSSSVARGTPDSWSPPSTRSSGRLSARS
jgi:hypothetical protein